MCGAAPLKITFKKTFNIPVNPAATQFFQGDPPAVKCKFHRTRIGISPVARDAGRNKFSFSF